MSEIHISYEVSKRLKEFLGESAPTPMVGFYWRPEDTDDIEIISFINFNGEKTKDFYPAYQLHDLLSKPFTDAIFKKIGVVEMTDTDMGIEDDYDVFLKISYSYYEGGLPAVERALMEMMK